MPARSDPPSARGSSLVSVLKVNETLVPKLPGFAGYYLIATGKRHLQLAKGDEVAARRRRYGDDARQALDVVRGCAMVPDDAARPRAGDRPRRVAPVRAEHKAAPAGDEVLVQSGCLPRVAAVVEEHKSGPGVPGPELEPGAHLSP